MSGLADIQAMKALSNSKKNSKITKFGYNLNNALFNYRVALSNVQNQLVKLYCFGDSITRGEYSSDEINKSWVGQLKTLLQTQYGSAGDGFISVYEGTLPAGAKPRVTLGTGWSTSVGTGFGGIFASSNSVTTDTTITFNGDSVDVLYTRGSGAGIATILIDGVQVGTVNCANGAIDYTQKVTYTGLSNGAHTLIFRPQTTAKVYLEGIIPKTGSVGIQVNKMGYSGKQASFFNNSSDMSRWSSEVAPDIVTLAFGMNDIMLGTSVTDYKSNLGSLISYFQSRGSSVILIPYMQPSSSWTTNDWVAYTVNTSYSLADQYNCGVIDIYQAWNKSYTSAQSLGLFGPSANDYSGSAGTNPAHPSDKGYYYIAQIIKSYLTI